MLKILKSSFFLLSSFIALAQKQEPRLVLPVGHVSFITSIKYSNDKKYFLTSSADATVRIWEAGSKKELITLSGHSDIVNNGEFSPDNKHVITSSNDGTVRIWNIENGIELKKIFIKHSKIKNAHYSPNGEFIVFTIEDYVNKSVCFYNSENLKEVYKLNFDCSIIDANFNFDGNHIIVKLFAEEKEEIVIDPLNNKEIINYYTDDGKSYIRKDINFCRIFNFKSKHELILEDSSRFDLITNEIRQTNKYLLCRRKDSVCSLYDFHLNEQHFFLSENKIINKIISSDEGKYIIVLFSDYSISLYDATSLIKKTEFKISSEFEFSGVSHYSNNGSLLLIKDKIILTDHKKVFIYTIHGKKINEFPFKKDFHAYKHYTLFGAKQNELINGVNNDEGLDVCPVFYSLKDGKVLNDLEGCVDFVATEKNLYNNHFENGWSIWDYRTGQSVRKFKDYNWKYDDNQILDSIFKNMYNDDSSQRKYSGFSTDFSNDSSLVLTAAKNYYYDDKLSDFIYRIRIFNKSGGILTTLDCKQTKSAQFNSSAQKIITVSYDDVVYIWDIKTSQAEKIFKLVSGRYTYIVSADFACNDKFIVISTYDSFFILDVNKNTIIQKFKGSTFGYNKGFSFNNNKTKLIINTNRQCLIYDLNKNKTVISLNSFDDWISSATFTTDDNYIVTTDRSNKTIVWDANTGKKMYTRLQLKKGDWLVYDEHYRFDGSKDAVNYLYLTCGLEVIDLALFKDSLWVPGLAEKIMSGVSITINNRPAPKLKDLNICERLQQSPKRKKRKR
jgi:WD40 repeat protein